MSGLGARAPRRAPRLRPDQRIGPYFTRLGRFRQIDPSKGRELPSLARGVGVLAWTLLLGESMRRAIRRGREERAAADSE
ncbi:MAG TPA: hypothetical protein VML96_01295 [Egibacteraceae bacterium]|nr:hypothetical protein [Egibacteraceae bacterium]